MTAMECERLAEGSALEMIAACFRHQHPEAFGGMPVDGPVLPMVVRYGREGMREPVFTREGMREPVFAQVMSEEVMGHPEARVL